MAGQRDASTVGRPRPRHRGFENFRGTAAAARSSAKAAVRGASTANRRASAYDIRRADGAQRTGWRHIFRRSTAPVPTTTANTRRRGPRVRPQRSRQRLARNPQHHHPLNTPTRQPVPPFRCPPRWCQNRTRPVTPERALPGGPQRCRTLRPTVVARKGEVRLCRGRRLPHRQHIHEPSTRRGRRYARSRCDMPPHQHLPRLRGPRVGPVTVHVEAGWRAVLNTIIRSTPPSDNPHATPFRCPPRRTCQPKGRRSGHSRWRESSGNAKATSSAVARKQKVRPCRSRLSPTRTRTVRRDVAGAARTARTARTCHDPEDRASSLFFSWTTGRRAARGPQHHHPLNTPTRQPPDAERPAPGRTTTIARAAVCRSTSAVRSGQSPLPLHVGHSARASAACSRAGALAPYRGGAFVATGR
jgi:hypothetical protein